MFFDIYERNIYLPFQTINDTCSKTFFKQRASMKQQDFCVFILRSPFASRNVHPANIHTFYLIMIPQMLMNVKYNKAKNRFIPIQNNKNEEWLFAYKLYIPEKDIVSIILSTIINRICLAY